MGEQQHETDTHDASGGAGGAAPASNGRKRYEMTPARAEAVKRMQAGRALSIARKKAQKAGVSTVDDDAPVEPAQRAGGVTVSDTPHEIAARRRSPGKRSASDTARERSESVTERSASDANDRSPSVPRGRSFTDVLRLAVGLEPKGER